MSETSDHTAALITPEHKVNEKESVIEKFRAERLKLWKAMMIKMKEHPNMARVLSASVNATVGAYVKLSAEAYSGKTIDQQQLTPLGRIIHAFIVTTGLASYGLVAAGHPEIAAITYGSSWAAYALMYGSEIISPTLQAAAEKMDKNHPNISNILRLVAKTSEKPKKLFFKS